MLSEYKGTDLQISPKSPVPLSLAPETRKEKRKRWLERSVINIACQCLRFAVLPFVLKKSVRVF